MTKALVNVLELGGPDVARSFLRRFAPALADGWPSGASPEFCLQLGPTGALPSGRRLLLGLSLRGQVDGPLVASEDGSRVDAAVLVAGVGLLAVEVKVVDDLDGPQLARHAQRWAVVEEPSLARWADVWRWGRDERRRWNGIAGFLLAQFCEYLEILGFAPWAGFRGEDVDFLRHPSWEQRTIVRNRVSGAWERIPDELDAQAGASAREVRRFEWPCPGDLLQIDTKRFGRSSRPGHKVTGDRRRTGAEKRMRVGWEFCHSMIDDHSRLAYTEIHPDEKAATVTAFVARALGFFAGHGVAAKRLQSDNAWSYTHNTSLQQLLAARGVHHRRIPPRTAKRNGKVERY